MNEIEYIEKEIENVKDLIKETENCSEYTSYMKENIIKEHNLTIATLNSIKQKLEAFEIIKNKGVDKKNLVESNNFREYNKNLLDTYRGTTYFKNEHNLKYTEQEFDTLNGVLK